MRVALVSWAPFYAGAEVAALRLALGLRESGHQPICIVGTRGELFQQLKEQGIQVYHVPIQLTDKWKYWRYWLARRKMMRILIHENPDLVHSNDLPTHQMTSDAARRVGLPRVCHHRWVFDGTAVDWLNKFGAERHIFISHSVADMLCQASTRLATSPWAIVYDGLPLPSVPTPDAQIAARQALQLPADKIIVLFAGQIIPVKGVADLLHAWARIGSQRWQMAELIIAGEDLRNRGCHRREMEVLAKKLGVSAKFVGFQKDISRWFVASDFVVVPSHSEPLGLVVMEAMSHCRPVIGSSVGGIPEMIMDGETGLLVPPASSDALAAAIGMLLDRPALRERMGLAGRRRCEEKFSLSAHVQGVLEQYEIVLEKGKHTPVPLANGRIRSR